MDITQGGQAPQAATGLAQKHGPTDLGEREATQAPEGTVAPGAQVLGSPDALRTDSPTDNSEQLGGYEEFYFLIFFFCHSTFF